MLGKATISSLMLCTMAAGVAQASNSSLQEFVDQNLVDIISNEIVIESIIKQNGEHASLTQNQIDNLDQQWRSEADGGSGELITNTLNKPLSDYLREVLEDSDGVYTEIFVMDDKGINVGQSSTTSDYWQGDESKWQETYLVGPDAIHASEVEFDESSQTYQLQISVPVVDSNTNSVIGAATFGVNAEALQFVSLEGLD